MKRCISLLAAVILINIPALPASGAGVGENLLINSGFESLDGWWATGGFGGEYVSHENTGAHTGSYCVKITATGAQMPLVTQGVYNTIEGAEYTVSCYVKSTTGSGQGFGYKFECYSDPYIQNGTTGYPGADVTRTERIWSTGGQWQYFEQSYRLPKGVKSFAIAARVYGTGTYYIDDMEVRIANDKPEMFTFMTDDVFYYSDRTDKGTAKVCLNTDAFPEYENAYVDFALKKGSTVLKREPYTLFSEIERQLGLAIQNSELWADTAYNGKTAVFELDMSLMTQLKTEYTVEAAVYDSDGGFLKSFSQPVYKYDRPSRLTKDGVYMLEGKRIDPVIGYHVDIEDYKNCAAAGINVVQIGYWYCDYNYPQRIDEVLAELEKYNLMGIACIYRDMFPAGHPRNLSNTQQLVLKLRGNKNIFAYALMDEPALALEYDRDMMASYLAVRNLDSEIPTFVVDCVEDDFAMTSRYADIAAVDPYPSARREVNLSTFPYEWVTLAKNAVQGKKPVYSILQTYEANIIFPTVEEVRHMWYQSLLAGAQGMGYYSMSDALIPRGQNSLSLVSSDRWPGLTEFASWEMEESFKVFLREEHREITRSTDSAVTYALWEDDEDQYLLVMSKEKTEPKSATIQLTGGGNVSARAVAGGEGSLFGTGGTLNVTVLPGEAVLYQLNFEPLLNGGFESGLEGWSVTDSDYVVLSGDAYDGGYSVRITRTADNNTAGQTVYLEENQAYTMTFAFKSGGAADPFITVNFSGEPINFMVHAPKVNEWDEYRFYFTAPREGDAVVTIGTDVKFKTVYYDSIKIEKSREYDLPTVLREGKEISGLTNGETEIIGQTEGKSGEGRKLIVAGFGNGLLKMVKLSEKTASADGILCIKQNALINDEIDTLKVFLWDNELRPYAVKIMTRGESKS